MRQTICPLHDLRPWRVMSIVASANSDANTKMIVSSLQSLFAWAPHICIYGLYLSHILLTKYTRSQLTRRSAVLALFWAGRPQFLLPSMLCVNVFYCHLSYFPVVMEKATLQIPHLILIYPMLALFLLFLSSFRLRHVLFVMVNGFRST